MKTGQNLDLCETKNVSKSIITSHDQILPYKGSNQAIDSKELKELWDNFNVEDFENNNIVLRDLLSDTCQQFTSGKYEEDDEISFERFK